MEINMKPILLLKMKSSSPSCLSYTMRYTTRKKINDVNGIRVGQERVWCRRLVKSFGHEERKAHSPVGGCVAAYLHTII